MKAMKSVNHEKLEPINTALMQVLKLLGFMAVLSLVFFVWVASVFAQPTEDNSRSRKLIGASINNLPPVNMLDDDRELEGFGHDLAEAVMAAIGSEVNHIHSAREDVVFNWLRSGRADFIHDIPLNLEGGDWLDYSAPILSIPEVIFTGAGRFDISGPESLPGKKVACLERYGTPLLIKQVIGMDCQVVSSPAEGLLLLTSGSLDAFVHPRELLLYQASRMGLENSIRIAGTGLRTLHWAMAVTRGNSEVLEQLNRGLTILRENGGYGRIYNKYFNLGIPGGYSVREAAWLAVSAAGGMFLLAVFFFWYFTSSRQAIIKKELEGILRDNRMAEKQLCQERDFTLNLFYNSGALLLLADREGRILRFNRAFERMTGFTEDDLRGEYIWERLLPEEEARSQKAVFGFLASGKGTASAALSGEVEVDCLDKGGQRHTLSWANTIIFDRDEYPDAVLVTGFEVTSQKQDRKELMDSEERFRAITSATPYALAIVRVSDGRILFTNPHFEKLFRVNRALTMDVSIGDFHSDPGIWEADLRNLAGEGSQKPVERLIRPMFGDPRWTLQSLRFMTYQGEAAVLLGCLDISDRKIIQDELEESREFMAKVLNLSPDAIISVDSEQKIIQFNGGAEKIFGYAPRDVLGKHLDMLIPGKFRTAHRQHIDNLAGAPEETRPMGQAREVAGLRKSGEEFPARAEITRMFMKGELVHTVYLVDMSRRQVDGRQPEENERQLQARQTELERQLRHSQKMDAVGKLAGGMAHEFNNMLQVVQGYTELALARKKMPRELREWLGKIKTASLGGSHLTRQLLSFSRNDIMEPRQVEMNAMVTELARMLERLIGENIDLRLELNPGGLQVWGDRNMMEQVLLNLCVNARDAMPQGGVLRISTASISPGKSFRKTHGLPAEGEITVLKVSDTGQGMGEDVQERIFEPFFTTKEPGAGTGLGLSLVYSMVRQHGGGISVKSMPGKGAEFSVMFPLAEVKPAPRGEPEVEQQDPGGDETILIAEDDEAVRESIALMLSGKGYRILKSSSGEEALEVFKSKNGGIDLVLLDMVMPGLSGRETMESLRKIDPDIPILFNTGYASSQLDQEFMRRHQPTVLKKPFPPAQLYRTVRRLLDEASWNGTPIPPRRISPGPGAGQGSS